MKQSALLPVCLIVALFAATLFIASPALAFQSATVTPTRSVTPSFTLPPLNRTLTATATQTPLLSDTPTALPTSGINITIAVVTATPEPTLTPTPTSIPITVLPLVPGLPAFPGQGVISPASAISPANIENLNELAAWGRLVYGSSTLSPDGNTLAIPYSGGVQLFDVSNFSTIAFIESPVWVSQVAFSPDGQMLAAATLANSFLIFHIPDGALVKAFDSPLYSGKVDKIVSACFSPDGSLLATGTESGRIETWQVSDWTLLNHKLIHNSAVYSLAFSPDGLTILSGGGDNLVRLTRTADLKPLQVLKGHTNKVNQVTFSADGQYIASASADQTAHIWRLSDWYERTLRSSNRFEVNQVLFTPDGGTLISSRTDGVLQLWSVASGQLLLTQEAHPHSQAREDEGDYSDSSIVGLALTPDGGRLITNTPRDLKVWQFSDWAVSFTLESAVSHSGQVTALEFSRDGGTLFTGGSDGSVIAWEASSGKLKQAMQKDEKHVGHNDRVLLLAVSGDGTRLASAAPGYKDSSVLIWNTQNGRLQKELSAPKTSSLAYSPDGKLLAAGTEEGAICIFRTRDWKKIKTLWLGQKGKVFGLNFSSDSRSLTSGSAYGTARIWNMHDWTSLQSSQWATNPLYSLAFSADRETLASGEGRGVVRLWRVNDGRLLQTLAPSAKTDSGVISVAFSPDGQLVAATYDNRIDFWQTLDGKLLRTIERGANVNQIAFSPDGKLLACAYSDGSLRLWGAYGSSPLSSAAPYP